MSHAQTYQVRVQDGDGQPLTSWEAWGMKEVREIIATGRVDWAHYDALRFLVTNEADVVVIDRTYKMPAPAAEVSS
jgi:hypothetical protein